MTSLELVEQIGYDAQVAAHRGRKLDDVALHPEDFRRVVKVMNARPIDGEFELHTAAGKVRLYIDPSVASRVGPPT